MNVAPAPVAVVTPSILAERAGVKMAAAVTIATDNRLRPATRLFALCFLWRYRPGRVWKAHIDRLALEMGIGARTAKRAMAELVGTGYFVRAWRGAYAVPLVESCLPANCRARIDLPVQRTLPDHTPASVRRYVSTMRRRSAESAQVGTESAQVGTTHRIHRIHRIHRSIPPDPPMTDAEIGAWTPRDGGGSDPDPDLTAFRQWAVQSLKTRTPIAIERAWLTYRQRSQPVTAAQSEHPALVADRAARTARRCAACNGIESAAVRIGADGVCAACAAHAHTRRAG